ncbi:outer membrane protein assembly factor BamB family protein [Nannocystis bainbridge]|uniref:PQQ-binding-like beta-propeller repeat protein n=1 Tax=Nannocystis bainbridge TaxID=2995303 RepID=A0ABT5DSA6_9BACT|nr:PQQ-binding-like beta-propeller repeat protein [Nannocystis bainbridge]MDC0715944.1 PQQ-binding-like beta-propeller repeat protein [Nannocystis bainbridge]
MRRKARRGSALALVIVLAACRRGDPSRSPGEAATSAPPAGPGAAKASTGPLGQVVTIGGEALPPALARRRAEGVAAMDGGRHDLARQAFAEVLDAAPDNLATQALFDAATEALLVTQARVSEWFAGSTATVLPAPPWAQVTKRPAPIEAGPPPTLTLVSERTDASGDAEWLTRNGLALPEYAVPNPMRGDPGALPPTIPPTFGKFLLVQAIHQDGFNILFYGADYAGGRLVAVQREDTAEIVALFDFEAYALPPGTAAGERTSAAQRATWAAIAGPVLLVGHAHAAEARGDDGFITALDVDSGELLWRSAPRVANAADFVVHRGHVYSGHGTAGGPGQLYVLDATTGKTVSTTPLRRGPDYLFLEAGRLRVRGGGTDYVFELRDGGG